MKLFFNKFNGTTLTCCLYFTNKKIKFPETDSFKNQLNIYFFFYSVNKKFYSLLPKRNCMIDL